MVVSSEDVIKSVNLVRPWQMFPCEMRCAAGGTAVSADDGEWAVRGVAGEPLRQRYCAAMAGYVAVAIAVAIAIVDAATPAVPVALQAG